MNIHESGEDYLEAVMILQEKKGYVRSVDIAAHLNVTKPSVSVAMKRLRENGYIAMDEENLISLTPQGAAIARRVYERHKVLISFFTQIGVDPATAREDACKIEHDISQATFEAIKNQLK